ncbi:putative O-linked N-acetylglucosamine transferase (SPINDLY family) [Rhizobium sp. BIGb0125]|uniref:O-linked N-acetylglucosamine transferase, SPINDLY family protein n=1 Tax=Rhizobium sp. BIGb0125 TaxID=2940618 RepID=UPI00216A621A|nr:glycosyl transferase [Rhizobium sp. BIGb0125]MCS4243548.1 putative O-linked N-acetylglucosamine transferase (SPINDLY family) [Rhizobium sp. BIGb0125]
MNINSSFLTANQEYQKGNYIGALHVLNGLLDTRQDTRTYALLGRTFLKLDMKEEAASAFALAGNAGGTDAERHLHNAMMLHYECGNEDEALVIAKKFLHKAHKDADVAFVMASIFIKRGQKDILGALRKPLIESAKPNHLAVALHLLADAPHDEDNFKTIRRTLKLFPDNQGVRLLHLIHSREFCEFESMRKHQPILDAEVAGGNLDIIRAGSPFYSLMWCGDEKLNQIAAMATRAYEPGTPERRRARPHDWSNEKIRVGYLSYDLWDAHATMKLLGNVLERHDRDRFEITLFCYTPEEHLSFNKFDRSLWGNVVRIVDMTDEEAANTIRAHNIDILVDLKGHTKGNRTQIMNHETAPVHVSWLGFPGTSINLDIDYIIGDRFVLPEYSKPYFYEKFCRLPETYQPNDPVHRPAPRGATRKDFGLPEDAFIFASFNANRKITAEYIEIWGTILERCKNSLLWIMVDNERARTNILKEMDSRGISAKRVLFSPKVSYEEHLDRLNLADVGLDTFPVNGHTTTSEQLWAGLPVLTRVGTNFASRVSESLLHAIGLPELVAQDDAEYLEKAIALYENRAKAAEYKQRLTDNRFVAPLFDAERFCQHLERAYEMMVEEAKAGRAPEHFDVPAFPAREGNFAPPAKI